MQIELSKEEYRNLIDMIQIAEWVMNAHKTEKDPSTEKYSKLEQRSIHLQTRWDVKIL